jgi:hypothetical protein
MAVSLRIRVDRHVMNIVSTISGNTIREVDMEFSIPSTRPSTTELPVDELTMTPADQTDHEMNNRIAALPSPSHSFELLWSDNESDQEYDGPRDPLTEHDYPIPPDHITEGEITSHEISTDSSIDVDDALQTNEAIDLERVHNNLSGTGNRDHLYARIVVLTYSILASAVGKPKACLISSLYEICGMMSNFLILYPISRSDIDQISIEFSLLSDNDIPSEHLTTLLLVLSFSM